MKNFLIINPFGIGDVLFTTPVARAIKEFNPQASIGYWCNERVCELLRYNPDIDRTYGLSRGDMKKIMKRSAWQGIKRSWRLLHALRSGRYDVALDFSLDHRYGFISSLVGIPRRIGFDYRGRGRFLTSKIPLEGYFEKHMVDYYLDVLATIGIKSSTQRLQLCCHDGEKKLARERLFRQGIREDLVVVALVPGGGASWGERAALKRWRVERFTAVAKKLLTQGNIALVILGDDAERPLAEALCSEVKGPVVDCVGKTTLSEMVGIIANCALVVANDGGPLHIAVALRVPTVSVFGPVDPVVYGPYPRSAEHIVVTTHLTCQPCYRRFRIDDCARVMECLDTISIDEVYKAIRRLV